MATYYLDPSATGANNGGAGNDAWQSWATAIAAINSAHADMVATTTPVDVLVSGPMETITGALNCTVNCNDTYPLRFIAQGGTPGIWDETKPTLCYQRAGTTEGILFSGATANLSVHFIGLNFLFDHTNTTSSGVSFFRNNVGKTNLSRVYFSGCYIKSGAATAGNTKYFWNGSSTNVAPSFINCVVEGFVQGGTSGVVGLGNHNRIAAEGIVNVINCTLVGNDEFIRTGTGGLRAINNLFSSSGTTQASGTTTTPTGKNVSNESAATAPLPGSDNTNDASFAFVSSTDRHLVAANTWGAGPDDVTYGSYVPTTDIDGDTRVGATTSAGADLPASGIIISAGTITNVTTQGFQVQFETDTANGTAYYVVFPTTAPDPTAAQIVAETDGDNTAALASGNQSVSTTGVQTFSPAVTGLSPNTTYRVSVVHYGTPV